MASLATAARLFARVARAGIVAATEAPVLPAPAAPAPVVEVAPAPAPVDPFAALPALWDDDEITGTPGAVAPAVAPAPVGPAKPYTAEDMPSAAVIELAAVAFDQAADQARQADRSKRKSRKILDRCPSGRFGRAKVSWEESSRQTPDLEKIAALLKTIGVDEIPMRDCAPTLRVEILSAA
jgi:hypothetical protein